MDLYNFEAEYIKNYDVDSITLKFSLGFHLYMEANCRVKGIDGAEMRPKKAGRSKESLDREIAKAIAAKHYVTKVLKGAKEIHVKSHHLDKYSRPLVAIEYDGVDLATDLIEKGHAVSYDGGRKTHDWGA